MGGCGDLNRLAKARTLRTVEGPLLLVVTKAYHLHVFLSLANLNIQKSLKHSNTRRGKAELNTRAPCRCARREPRLTDSNTEPSSPSPPAPGTNKYKSQFKHANRKRCERAQFSTRVRCSVRMRLKALKHRICLFYKIMSKYPSWRVSSKKTVGYVLSESKQWRNKSGVYHYIGCIVS